MTDSTTRQFAAANDFAKLHEPAVCLPNPWDPGTAVYLAALGFAALATSSAGFAFCGITRWSYPVTRDAMLAHIREVVRWQHAACQRRLSEWL